MPTRKPSDVIIVGAGVVGAACAYYAALAGLSVTVVDRGSVAGGTTGAGEGNLLVSDKEPGPELELALLATSLWRELADVLPSRIEYETKGGLVVAADETGTRALREFAARQEKAGVTAREIPGDRLHDLEPHLAPGLAGGFLYPQDAQVMLAHAAAQLLRAGGDRVRLRLDEEVTGLLTGAAGEIRGVCTARGELHAPYVVNAAGTWGGALAELAGVHLPVLPRRGFVLVTEPLPRVVRHKVYAADYVADVASDSAALQTSAVVEGTPRDRSSSARAANGSASTGRSPPRSSAAWPPGRSGCSRSSAPYGPSGPTWASGPICRTTCPRSAPTHASTGCCTPAVTRERASAWRR